MSIVASNNDLEYASFEGFEDQADGFAGHLDGASSISEDEINQDQDQDTSSDQEQNTDVSIMEPDPTVDMGATVEEEDDENMNAFMGGYSSGMGSDMGSDMSGFANYEGFEDNTEAEPVPEPKNNSMSMNNLLSLDLLLKSILFGLLFYLVAHPDVCNMMKKVFGKLKGEPLRLACMALFVVCYYVINLLI